LVKVSWRGCQALIFGGRKEDKEGEQERERDGEVSPECVPKGRYPQPGSPSEENAQLVSQASLHYAVGAPAGVRGIPGIAL
jgi:hypothetical protein